ncbi:tetratricopeptide repeat protein [Hymenobacter psychrotolerans]|uniref:Tetratricopeptide repeat-containing protein n=1 Tax=Hymenobacter psychrotolerans DSM 18569 TaxID=1121959 RepID=A0A1M7FA19_9BACT|nr:tetratricopeptide repeat protein [Hymenobacter psychrotolerans]SHM00901.1 hypothetical protein SAMN02746009_03796 [Hymenobacter psychrotolerans DSM 18569]
MYFFQARLLLSVLLLLGGLLSSRPARALPRNYWNTNYDSLRRTLPQQPTDTARLRTLAQLLDITELSDAQRRQQALPLLDELLALNQRLPLLDARPYRHLRTGLGLWVQGGTDARAMAELHQAVSLFDLAPLYNRMHQSEARLAYFRQQLAYYRLRNYRENTAACYLVLGGSYRHPGDFNQAISCYLHAADLFRHFDRRLYANELMVAGSTYAEWGNHAKPFATCSRPTSSSATTSSRACRKSIFSTPYPGCTSSWGSQLTPCATPSWPCRRPTATLPTGPPIWPMRWC